MIEGSFITLARRQNRRPCSAQLAHRVAIRFFAFRSRPSSASPPRLSRGRRHVHVLNALRCGSGNCSRHRAALAGAPRRTRCRLLCGVGAWRCRPLLATPCASVDPRVRRCRRSRRRRSTTSRPLRRAGLITGDASSRLNSQVESLRPAAPRARAHAPRAQVSGTPRPVARQCGAAGAGRIGRQRAFVARVEQLERAARRAGVGRSSHVALASRIRWAAECRHRTVIRRARSNG